MSVVGFPPESFDFYAELSLDNTRTFWQANKDRYRRHVREPLDAVLADLDEYGSFHVFRPYNDVRFATGRPPYKDHQGAYGEREGGAGFYRFGGSATRGRAQQR